MRERQRVTEAIVGASLLSAAPSAVLSYRRHRALGPVVADLLEATRAVGTLLPARRPGLLRGALVHLGVSAICGELLAHTLPQRHAVVWGAGGGLAIGVVNLALIGRRFPQIRALPLAPQLADNVAFGVVFALIVDR